MKRTLNFTFYLGLLILVPFTSCKRYSAFIGLPSIFSEGMVMQQQAKVPVWGKAEPGKTINIEGSWGEIAKCKSNNQGIWQAKIKTPEYGGPYTLIVKSGSIADTIANILFGEVWLASGQSNMEMTLSGWPPKDTIANGKHEIEQATNNHIRFFTVAKSVSAMPEDDCVGQWKASSPEDAKKFSATAYFFAKELYARLKVPVGIVHSSWGGTPVESWTDKEHLATLSAFDTIMAIIDSNRQAIIDYYSWFTEREKIIVADSSSDDFWAHLDFNDLVCASPHFNDSAWYTTSLPGFFEETALGYFDGTVWYRKVVNIPEAWSGKKLMLELGPIDDMDATYFNGVKMGGHEKEGLWQVNRVYPVPANQIKPGRNLIAVRVIDNQGGGGIYGKPEKLKLYPADHSAKAISLAGDWKYLPVSEYFNSAFYIFDLEAGDYYKKPIMPVPIGPYTPSFLYNSMIHPIVPYAIKGAIWYQGEANVGNPKLYTRSFPLLIKSWREVWQQGAFPFYYVQIAPWEYGEGKSQELREAQFKTLKVKNTGMAVTLDIGDTLNIHPANKTDVGKRLAYWALAKDYGMDISYSGPVYNYMETKGNKIHLYFDYTYDGLTSPEQYLSYFQIAGPDSVFTQAKAIIENDQVIVWNKAINNPVAVRYSWGNTTLASLFNSAGLPASSFRTDDW